MRRGRLLTGRRVFGSVVAAGLLIVQGWLLVTWLNPEFSWRAAVNSGFHTMDVKLGLLDAPVVAPPASAAAQGGENGPTTARVAP